MLQSKGRINIYQFVKDFLASISDINGLLIKYITSEIAAETVILDNNFHSDPADRIIVARAKIYGSAILTRDSKILS